MWNKIQLIFIISEDNYHRIIPENYFLILIVMPLFTVISIVLSFGYTLNTFKFIIHDNIFFYFMVF